MNAFPHLAQRILNTPIAIHPGKAEVIMAAVGERLGVTQVVKLNGQLVAGHDWAVDLDEDEPAEQSGYDVVGDVAIIGVKGTLVQRSGWLRPFSGMTGYDGIRQNFITAMNDPAVDAIALDIDSPGGEVAGCFDLVDTIYAARGEKPIWAILSENAYSAAYALASAADYITVPRTGGVGSVGVIYMHTSYEGFLRKTGVEVTLVTKGDLKGEGNEFKNLSDATFKRLRADVLKVGALFDATVARNRGLEVDEVYDTQAGTFLGKAGVEIGFADAVMAPHDAFQALLTQIA